MIVLSSFVFSIVMRDARLRDLEVAGRSRATRATAKPIHGNTKLEIAWTVIPTVIVLFGAGYSWIVLDDIEANDPDRMAVDVTAQQFEWTLRLPGADDRHGR